MPLVLMSNPGLPLAILGNPRRRRGVRIPRGLKRKIFAQALRRAKRRVGRTRRHGRGSYRVTRFVGVLRKRTKRHLHGIPWSGRRGYLGFFAKHRRPGKRRYGRSTFITNPARKHTMARRRRSHRRARRNPGAIAGYLAAAKRTPSTVMGLFKGPNKVKHIAFAAGGAVATYLAGGILASKVVVPVLGRIPVINKIAANPMGQRVLGGLIPFTLGYVASKFVKGQVGQSLLVGGTIAGLAEIAMPGLVGRLVAKIPGVPALASAAPAVAAPAIVGPTNGLNGLDGYVRAPSYAGVGGLDGYVRAPSYAGVGDEDDLAGYVRAPSYAGVGEEGEIGDSDAVMAGVDGYLEQAQAGYQSYLAA